MKTNTIECKHCNKTHDLSSKDGFETNFALANLINLLNLKHDDGSIKHNPNFKIDKLPIVKEADSLANMEKIDNEDQNNNQSVLKELLGKFTKHNNIEKQYKRWVDNIHGDQVDLKSKLNRLNNDLNLVEIDYGFINDNSIVTKSIGLLDKNTILFVDEKIYGKGMLLSFPLSEDITLIPGYLLLTRVKIQS